MSDIQQEIHEFQRWLIVILIFQIGLLAASTYVLVEKINVLKRLRRIVEESLPEEDRTQEQNTRNTNDYTAQEEHRHWKNDPPNEAERQV